MTGKTYDKPYTVSDGISHHIKWDPTPQEVILKQVTDAIALDREQKTIAALISLGWTPPPDKKYPSEVRLSPDGKHNICDQCHRTWKPGDDPGCPPCAAAWERLGK